MTIPWPRPRFQKKRVTPLVRDMRWVWYRDVKVAPLLGAERKLIAENRINGISILAIQLSHNGGSCIAYFVTYQNVGSGIRGKDIVVVLVDFSTYILGVKEGKTCPHFIGVCT